MNRARLRRTFSDLVETPVTGLLARLGVPPNAITLAGLPAAGAAAYLVSTSQLWPAGVVVLAAGLLDLMDGALARATRKVTRFGGLLDSVTDRITESIVLLGLLVMFVHEASMEGAVLAFVSVVSSVMVSYVRARAEGLGVECEVGVMTRPERVAALGAGLIVAHWWPTAILIVLGALSALAVLTTWQRVQHVRRELDRAGTP